MRLSKVLPSFAEELTALLLSAKEPELAAQVETLEIVQKCSCTDEFCSSFYTLPKPYKAYGPNHRNVSLDPAKGMIILDVVEERIAFVEVFDRDDVKPDLANIA